MRKKRWELDETMLAIVFGFAGLHKNIKSPSYYSSGVISDLMAFKFFLLEWKIWKYVSNLISYFHYSLTPLQACNAGNTEVSLRKLS
jgi:hypothetical protein